MEPTNGRFRSGLRGLDRHIVLGNHTPVGTATRQTRRDVTLAGVTIPQGHMVAAVLTAANRDPRRWPDPDRFAASRYASASSNCSPASPDCGWPATSKYADSSSAARWRYRCAGTRRDRSGRDTSARSSFLRRGAVHLRRIRSIALARTPNGRQPRARVLAPASARCSALRGASALASAVPHLNSAARCSSDWEHRSARRSTRCSS